MGLIVSNMINCRMVLIKLMNEIKIVLIDQMLMILA
jgi:hypothetical protein